MRMTWLLILAWSLVPLWAQSGAHLDIDLDHLDEKAEEVVRVDLDGTSLAGVASCWVSARASRNRSKYYSEA